jgi:hypothetical protein
MPTYLLPCACGRKLPVALHQAGLKIACECGATLDAPTRRGLAALEEAAELPAAATRDAPRAEGRSLRQKGLFLALAVTLVALATGGALTWYEPRDPVVDAIRTGSLVETIQYWQHFRERSAIRVDSRDDPHRDDDNFDLMHLIQRKRLWANVCFGIAGLGAIGALAALALPGGPRSTGKE